jgi:Vitamin K-dependent gamma-carboxylase
MKIEIDLRKFFFKREPTEGIAIFRICLGIATLISLFGWAHNFSDICGEYGICNNIVPNKMTIWYWAGTYSNSYTLALIILGLCVASSITLTLGYKTRISAFLTYALYYSLYWRCRLTTTGADHVYINLLLLTTLSNAGGSLSIDSLIRSYKEKFKRPWPRFSMPLGQRLIQLQMSYIYIIAVLDKAETNVWVDGTVMYYVGRNWDAVLFNLPYVYDHLWTIKLMSWGSLATETILGTLIWYKPLRIPIILLGIGLHIGIGITLNLVIFQIIMIAGLVSMLEPKQAFMLIRKKKFLQIKNNQL